MRKHVLRKMLHQGTQIIAPKNYLMVKWCIPHDHHYNKCQAVCLILDLRKDARAHMLASLSWSTVIACFLSYFPGMRRATDRHYLSFPGMRRVTDRHYLPRASNMGSTGRSTYVVHPL